MTKRPKIASKKKTRVMPWKVTFMAVITLASTSPSRSDSRSWVLALMMIFSSLEVGKKRR